ncbi:hypothetical protein GAO03_22485 [Bacteroides thetaiotaomicron]|nr:hypothetical protein GAO03_22485 [Bacteroides thetaiotaomicron]
MPCLWHDDATPLAQLCHALVTTVSKPLSQLCHTLVTTVTLLWHNCAHYLAQAGVVNKLTGCGSPDDRMTDQCAS